jgi:FAD/FMN-containing dehydrogenase
VKTLSPKSELEIAEILQNCNPHSNLIVPRGLDTHEIPAPQTRRELTAISLSSLNNLSRFEPADFYIACQCGMRLIDLFGLLTEKNLVFPFLENDSHGTVGGMVASGQLSNGSGCFQISRWVIAVRVVMGDGTIIKTGAVTYKSVAGYDLPKLFCGSFGTLGVITEAVLRCYPASAKPFGKDLLPVLRRVPVLSDISKLPAPPNKAEEIAQRIKRSFDPNGIFPVITGWNQR